MKANELTINSFLQTQNIQFVIPVYQRNYDWSSKECKELLNDIISVEQEQRGTHFIGSIVFIHEGLYSTDDIKELVIIDGQQRLTTINILYVALYRFAKESGNQQSADMLYNMYLTNQYAKQESNKLKLKQTDTNSLAFKSLMNQTENDFDKYSNVIENYNYFRSRIDESNFTTIMNGIKRLIFVEVSLERGKDDPQRIFESLNSTGLDLSQSDLIRNFILMDLEPRDQVRVFEQIWNPIEENARDLNMQKSMVSDYIRDYLTLKNKKIPNKSAVYLEFKKLYFNKKDEEYNQELEKIKSLSSHYKKLINPHTVSDPKLRKELEYITRLEINVAYPFLLQVFEDADNGIIDNETLIKVLKLIQTYAWRRFVVGLQTNALNKIFMALYSEIDTEDYYNSIAVALIKKKGNGKFPNNEELLTALKDKDLYSIKPKNRNYMFEMLENYNNREFVDTSKEEITIEHIFPQNPEDEWNNDLSNEDFFEFKEKYLNTIANLTLSGNNGALSNKTFSKKQSMDINKGQQGYKFSRLWLNSYLNTIDSWNIENYNNRFEKISERFLKIWEYPDVEIPTIEEGDEQNIFDAESPTNREIEYFIFENTKVEESVIAQMYLYVLKKLYKKNAEFLLSLKDVVKISRNKNDLRGSRDLINGYFTEISINSNVKFNILKKLLTAFELEEELIIKYSSNSTEIVEASRHIIRRNFWKQILPQIKNTQLFKNVNPSRDSWLCTGGGIGGMSYTIVATKSYIRLELIISSSSKEQNKHYFHEILKHKTKVEEKFKGELVWEELPDNKMSRIKYELNNVSIFNEDDWETMSAFVIDNLPRFEQALKPEIELIKKKIR